MKEKEFMQQHSNHLKSEYGMNTRKLRYNRGSAAEAVVSSVSCLMLGCFYVMNGADFLMLYLQIITGKGQNVVDPVFPQKATHHQCLAITNKLSMPNPNTIPPDVPAPRKWLGDDKGWA